MMNRNDGRYDIYHAYSTDHGVTWSTPERINDDKTGEKRNPDIGADSAGYAYIVWEDGRGIWFSTNNPFGGKLDSHPIPGSFGTPPEAFQIEDCRLQIARAGRGKLQAPNHKSQTRALARVLSVG